MSQVDAIAVIVIPGREAGCQHPAFTEEHVDQNAAKAVKCRIRGPHRADKRFEYPDLFIGPVFSAEFHSLIMILYKIERANRDGQEIRVICRRRDRCRQNSTQRKRLENS